MSSSSFCVTQNSRQLFWLDASSPDFSVMLWISEHHRVITFASRHKHAGQLAHHSNESDAPCRQRHIEKSGRYENEKAETRGFGKDKGRDGIHPQGEHQAPVLRIVG